MEKKIKSVKLKNDYQTEDFVYLKGHIGEIDDYGHCCRFRKKTGEFLYFSKSDIENNKTDLFEIEYEPERKSIVFTREDMIEFAYKCRHLVEPPESRIDKFISERKPNGR